MRNERTWTFISTIFHPLFMPTLGAFVVMWNDPLIYLSFDSLQPWVTVLGVVFGCTAIVPLFFCYLLLKMKRISSLTQPTESDRRTMTLYAELGFLLTYLSFHSIPTLGHSISLLLLGINIATVATIIINLFQRTSFHTTAVGGLVGGTIGLMYRTGMNLTYWIAGAIVLAIITGLARFKLKAHSSFEIYLGYIIGIASLATVFLLGNKL